MSKPRMTYSDPCRLHSRVREIVSSASLTVREMTQEDAVLVVDTTPGVGAVFLPPSECFCEGSRITIANRGPVNIVQVFPRAGDQILGGAAASIDIGPLNGSDFVKGLGNDWIPAGNA